MDHSTGSRLRARRSFIFLPGLKPEMFPKAVASGADIVCIDIEDAIHPDDKEEALTSTLALTATRPEAGAAEVVVRINSVRTPQGLTDLAAVIAAGPDGPPSLMLPKVGSADEVAMISGLLDDAGLDTTLHAIIESAAGLEHCWQIGHASTRLQALFFGAVDLSSDLGCENTWETMLYGRSRMVAAAAGAGLDAIDVPWLDLEDMAGMKAEAEASRRLGFVGKGSIHPKQIATLHEVFSPSAEEVAHARRIVAAFEEAATGLVVIDGKLIEKPVLRAMERILERAARVG
ncbi:MAG: CoA ester lyase [Rhodospirillaceae bacterium]|nr:CoA ester lyase [Rhodospirillaceae bacterium]MBT6205951.1 CoA ester lyase [Rhodospirillaceae bacterium]MBT6510265.1 CoA ester lyase [Rhodospirillaceae bacterium]